MNLKRKLFTISIICFIILGSALPLFSQAISITYIKIKKDKKGSRDFNTTAEIIVNNAIKIRGIRVTSGSGGLRFKLPEYVSSRNKVYPQVILLSKKAELVFREALESGEARGESSAKNTFRLGQFRRFDTPSALKAVALVTFDEAIEIECKIFDGENGPWVSWPSLQNPENGRWKKLVDFTDYKLRESVERMLLDRYNSAGTDNTEDTYDAS